MMNAKIVTRRRLAGIAVATGLAAAAVLMALFFVLFAFFVAIH